MFQKQYYWIRGDIMGWIIALCLFIGGCVTGDSNIFIAAGLFAIAGSINLGRS